LKLEIQTSFLLEGEIEKKNQFNKKTKKKSKRRKQKHTSNKSPYQSQHMSNQ